jgi:hypothetical protein
MSAHRSSPRGIRLTAVDARRASSACQVCREERASATLFFDGRGPGTHGTKICDYCLDDLRGTIDRWMRSGAPRGPARVGASSVDEGGAETGE